jgi:hypothetical protein
MQRDGTPGEKKKIDSRDKEAIMIAGTRPVIIRPLLCLAFIFGLILCFSLPAAMTTAGGWMQENNASFNKTSSADADHWVLGHSSIGATAPATTWYLAEGASTGGFETWILVQNPNSNPVKIDIKYHTSSGEVQGPKDLMPFYSRRSYRISDTVTDFNVSTVVESSYAGPTVEFGIHGDGVICERATYFTAPGQTQWALGHSSKGVTAPSSTWYLAGADSTPGSETWILVQNPNLHEVAIGIEFHSSYGLINGPVDIIPPKTRRSYRVNDYVCDYRLSAQVTATGGDIVCEQTVYRPTYSYQTHLGNAWSTSGATETSSTWYMAEGANDRGFYTSILVQNPNPTAVTIEIRCNTEVGEIIPYGGLPITDTIPAMSSKNVEIGLYVGSLHISTQVRSLTPGTEIVCWRYTNWSTAYGAGSTVLCHGSIGAVEGNDFWYLAEGCSEGGFETWILVQNPNPDPVEIDIVYHTLAEAVQGPKDTLPPYTRRSYLLNSTVTDYNVSAMVTSSGGDIICERSVYLFSG